MRTLLDPRGLDRVGVSSEISLSGSRWASMRPTSRAKMRGQAGILPDRRDVSRRETTRMEARRQMFHLPQHHDAWWIEAVGRRPGQSAHEAAIAVEEGGWSLGVQRFVRA